ncbi:histone deacetylase family protein [Terasakiella pusilla]|uniref:histone deacetylase family protein n=1 Tax=Terasakiella pusilla TaxID=64973 RepID=UPI003AA896E3
MNIFLNNKYAKHNAQGEIHHGEIVPAFENPSRLNNIIACFKENGVEEFLQPTDHGIEPIRKIHPDHYVTFLQTIWDEWAAGGNTKDIVPYVWPVPGLKRMHHDDLPAKVGNYAFSSDSSITAGTWEAAYEGVQTVLSALDFVDNGNRMAFALTRPPGHHAHAAAYGGYCFLNNGAIAAQYALDKGYKKVCILDVDYHHGNGAQDIFYERSDVLTVSLHGHPATNFPFYLGYDHEKGEGDGKGFNLNLGLADGSTFADWENAFVTAAEKVKQVGADFMIVPLGVDTYEGDPISKFKLKSEDFLQMGRLLAELGLPTVFQMEGGYDVGPIGQNVYNVLQGFEDAAK